jgi:hypothetical protein
VHAASEPALRLQQSGAQPAGKKSTCGAQLKLLPPSSYNLRELLGGEAVGSIPDFTDQEIGIVRELTEQRYRKAVAVELADAEVKLDPAADALTLCPTLFWRERDANFVVFKTGSGRYRCQFFYHPGEHFGTGVAEYTDLAGCVTTLMRLQADHEAQQTGGAAPADQPE